MGLVVVLAVLLLATVAAMAAMAAKMVAAALAGILVTVAAKVPLVLEAAPLEAAAIAQHTVVHQAAEQVLLVKAQAAAESIPETQDKVVQAEKMV
jgi:hypothetical protein